ncbi:MAG: hypothetical protein GC146_06185 [Limimaricola sp.]|uniref:hypothetical protein n=1 Tax=Limimaricola sp. TaxID=2211665 RepID=UPI001D38139A|nr:hypothetical protein [Limimaricola sp.]MBI1416798.1 hypothetical protein [Limimaricola sp.]
MTAALSLSAAFAKAEESGEMVLTIGGEEQHFRLDPKQSDWGGGKGEGSGPDLMIPTIMGWAADEKTREHYGVFSLSFTMYDDDISSPELQLSRKVGDTWEQLFASDEKGGLTLEISEHQIDGFTATVSGTFTADMGVTPNYGRDVDLTNPLAVSGRFTAVLNSNKND